MFPRVLLVHNRYRVAGGEERSVDLQAEAFDWAGIPYARYERDSAAASKAAAARSLVRGGSEERALAEAVERFGAEVAHVHNLHPLIGPRGLAAARGAGARVVAHQHNVRTFCAIGVGERDGVPCERCKGRHTLPGLRLNCRGSVPEAVAYAAGLALHQPRLYEAVDGFVAPSEAGAGLLARRGMPRERIDTLAPYLPPESFADRSRADEGAYALVASRLSPEKGIETAIAACAAAGVPLKVAGDGPQRARLEELGSGVEFLGRLSPEDVRDLLAGAAVVLMPSRCHEFAPYTALEAMAQGVPVLASAMGGMPEMVGEQRCVAVGDADGLAARVAALWGDPRGRAIDGEGLLQRARERHGREAYVERLLAIYSGL